MNLYEAIEPTTVVSIGWIEMGTGTMSASTWTIIVVHVLVDVIARVDRYHNHMCVVRLYFY